MQTAKASRKQSSLSGKENAQGCVPQLLLGRPDKALGGGTQGPSAPAACAYPTPAGAGNPLNPIRDGDRGLQLFPMNEEFPVSAGPKVPRHAGFPRGAGAGAVQTAKASRKQSSLSGKESAQGCVPQLLLGRPD